MSIPCLSVDYLQQIYRHRFPKEQWQSRNEIWSTLCKHFLQKYIKPSDVVMDMGAGYCEFLRHIKCYRKIAVDKNPDTKKFATSDIEVLREDVKEIPPKFFGKIDVIFMCNFLEHLNSKEELLQVLELSYQLLKKDGVLLVLQPNINLTKERYWSFFDHKLPLNEDSVKEVLQLAKFTLKQQIKRFLPYTTKSSLPQLPFLVWLYLKMPTFLRPFAGQSFFLANKD